jgi:hypothetical protein
LSNYSETQIGAKLNADSAMMSQLVSSQSSLQVYSVLVQLSLTTALNMTSAPENLFMINMMTPQVFNVPQKCGTTNRYYSGQIEFNSAYFLVAGVNDSSTSLVIAIQQGNIMYVMVNKIMYLVSYDSTIQVKHEEAYPAYAGTYVLSLYIMDSPENMAMDTTCKISIIPFIGGLSTHNTSKNVFTLLGVSAGMTSVPVHIMAVSK